jgi:hypothetical protein
MAGILSALEEKIKRPAYGKDRAGAWSGDEVPGMGCRQLSTWRQRVPEGRLPR